MPKKRFSAEQIVTVLRQIEVLMSQGKAAPVACREAGMRSSCAPVTALDLSGSVNNATRPTAPRRMRTTLPPRSSDVQTGRTISPLWILPQPLERSADRARAGPACWPRV